VSDSETFALAQWKPAKVLKERRLTIVPKLPHERSITCLTQVQEFLNVPELFILKGGFGDLNSLDQTPALVT